jgi:hypothetical protein
MTTRLTKITYLVHRLKRLVQIEVLLKVYFGGFHSIIFYGVVFWGGSPDAKRGFLLQKIVVRIICGVNRIAHCKPLLRELKILTLPFLFILGFFWSFACKKEPRGIYYQ